MVVIVISGMPACGSSTAAKLLAKKLKLKHFSLGDYTKKDAAKVIKKEKETERAADNWKRSDYNTRKTQEKYDNVQKAVAKKGDVVIDSKLGIHILGNLADVKVWVKAPFPVRAGRVAERDGIGAANAKTILKEKETAERKNWEKIYGFDYFSQEKEADIVIDTSDKNPEEIVKIIIKKVKAKA